MQSTHKVRCQISISWRIAVTRIPALRTTVTAVMRVLTERQFIEGIGVAYAVTPAEWDAVQHGVYREDGDPHIRNRQVRNFHQGVPSWP